MMRTFTTCGWRVYANFSMKLLPNSVLLKIDQGQVQVSGHAKHITCTWKSLSTFPGLVKLQVYAQYPTGASVVLHVQAV